MKLVKYRDNWADEIKVNGWCLMTDAELETWNVEWATRFKHLDEQGSYFYYVGTNEEIEYTSLEEFLDSIKIVDISEDEANVLVKLFGKQYAFFPENYDLE